MDVVAGCNGRSESGCALCRRTRRLRRTQPVTRRCVRLSLGGAGAQPAPLDHTQRALLVNLALTNDLMGNGEGSARGGTIRSQPEI